jgi:hypothetical protein
MEAGEIYNSRSGQVSLCIAIGWVSPWLRVSNSSVK